jgi:hypothetical protein
LALLLEGAFDDASTFGGIGGCGFDSRGLFFGTFVGHSWPQCFYHFVRIEFLNEQ